MLETVLALLVSNRKIFPRRIAISRRTIRIIGREIDDENLCMGVVHGHAYLQIMAQAATKQFFSEHMTQNVRKQQRVLVDNRWVTGFSPGSNAPFHDAVLEGSERVFLLIMVHRG